MPRKVPDPPKRHDSRRNSNRKKAQRPPHPGEAERIATRRVKALELRKAGFSYREIAKQLGVDVKTAHDDVMAELLVLREATVSDAKALREIELERSDVAIKGLWNKVKDGDTQAISALVRVQERRAKLLGIDAPAKSEQQHSFTLTPADISKLTDEEIEQAIKVGQGLVAAIAGTRPAPS